MGGRRREEPGDVSSPRPGDEMRAEVLAAVSLLLGMIFATLTFAQSQDTFSISGDITVENAYPWVEPYSIEKKLVVHNGDNIKRTFILRTLVPENLENPKDLENLPLQYGAIPEPSWVVPMAPGGGQEIEIEENSSSVVDIWLNIPYQDNLTNQKWEAWISVKRRAEIGEVLEPELICKMWINTSADLPPPPPPPTSSSILIVILALGVAAAVVLLVLWFRRRKGVRKKIVLRV